MGGKISIGIIDQDGKLTTVAAHTKFMNGVIVNEAFSKNGDVSELLEFLAESKLDKYNEGLGAIANVPSDYGYVLVDTREGNFLAAQRFTHFDTIVGAEIANAEFFKRGGKAGADGLARMITHRRDWDDNAQEMVSVEMGPFSDAAVLKANPDLLYYEPGGPSRSFEVSYPAWNTVFHDYDLEGIDVIEDYLAARNLVSADDLSVWAEAKEEKLRVKAEMEEFEASTQAAPAPRMG